MLKRIVQSVFGSSNDRVLQKLAPVIEQINALEKETLKCTDEQLKIRTADFLQRRQNGESLDSLLPEAFATVREVSRRVLGMRPFDVQLAGGMILHKGQIAEMKTGEGKTLVATLPAYLNALDKKGVHIVTVNDYLARRDAEWMGKLYNFLGLEVGCIVPGLSDEERKKSFQADISYGTNNEFGFDYLRDNLKFSLEEMVQRPFHYAIIDEVDSILIDEARTPLIISGPAEDNTALYKRIDALIPRLRPEDYEIDHKQRNVTLTDTGTEHVERLVTEAGLLSEGTLYDIQNIALLHHFSTALRAHKVFQRDVDYIVRDGKIVIIDEFTGRMMSGRRYGDGLHQALEAREALSIEKENQTLASVTFQNYFRMYPKLAGMTGTATTEAFEFQEIYKLDVVEIPPHRPMIRKDYDDEIYRTAAERDDAVLMQIKECHTQGQPVLVGTVSIEKSERLSRLLRKHSVPHRVLNARHHESEAAIIAEAGRKGAVTIATNMAGRGTDIQLGGNTERRLQNSNDKPASAIEAEITAEHSELLELGGLFIIGTERHESRRIDNQLRGRSGRQGDAGMSRFYLSLDDDLMRIFGTDRLDGMLKRLGLREGEAIAHPWVNKALEKAQRKVEERNFDIRKQLLKFDDVMNDQRRVVFEQRKEIMQDETLSATVQAMQEDIIASLVSQAIPEKTSPEQWKTETLHKECLRIFGLDLPVSDWASEEGTAEEEIRSRIEKSAADCFASRTAMVGIERMEWLQRNVLLQVLDTLWKEHLLQLDHLRQGIGLRAYGQRDPLHEYKQEAFILFESLLARLRETVVGILFRSELATDDSASLRSRERSHSLKEQQKEPFRQNRPLQAKEQKIRRNAPCPCGSGKKYKHCHGKLL